MLIISSVFFVPLQSCAFAIAKNKKTGVKVLLFFLIHSFGLFFTQNQEGPGAPLRPLRSQGCSAGHRRAEPNYYNNITRAQKNLLCAPRERVKDA